MTSTEEELLINVSDPKKRELVQNILEGKPAIYNVRFNKPINGETLDISAINLIMQDCTVER